LIFMFSLSRGKMSFSGTWRPIAAAAPPTIYQTNSRRLQSFLCLPVPTNSFQSMNLNRRRLNRSCNRRAVGRVLMIIAAAANTKPSFFPRRVSGAKKRVKRDRDVPCLLWKHARTACTSAQHSQPACDSLVLPLRFLFFLPPWSR
jgi:hypothetical protein